MNEEHTKLVVQFSKYFGVAGIGYIFDFSTLLILHELSHVHYLIAAVTGFIVGLVVLYILSSLYVFKDPKIKSRSLEFGIFTIIGIIGLGILSLLMWLLTGLLGINYLISKILATVVVYIWNFFARRMMYRN